MISASPELLEAQNRDGGWSYRRGGSSWTEPTCYALLALAAAGRDVSEAAQRGVRWLADRQRADGGWAPRPGVDESTWVTALVLLLPGGMNGGVNTARAAAWLVAETGRESTFVERLRMRLLGAPLDPSQAFDGWPWFPGAAAWVTPTALSILALEKLDRRKSQASLRDRIAQGRGFLLARRCRDGGWNHGSTKALGYDSDSYPETTGVALLALHDSKAAELAAADSLAERQLSVCQSSEAASWLTLGLCSRGRRVRTTPPPMHSQTIELALASVAEAAVEGHNLFLE